MTGDTHEERVGRRCHVAREGGGGGVQGIHLIKRVARVGVRTRADDTTSGECALKQQFFALDLKHGVSPATQ